MEVLDQLNEFFRQYFGIGLIAAVVVASRWFNHVTRCYARTQ